MLLLPVEVVQAVRRDHRKFQPHADPLQPNDPGLHRGRDDLASVRQCATSENQDRDQRRSTRSRPTAKSPRCGPAAPSVGTDVLGGLRGIHFVIEGFPRAASPGQRHNRPRHQRIKRRPCRPCAPSILAAAADSLGTSPTALRRFSPATWPGRAQHVLRHRAHDLLRKSCAQDSFPGS